MLQFEFDCILFFKSVETTNKYSMPSIVMEALHTLYFILINMSTQKQWLWGTYHHFNISCQTPKLDQIIWIVKMWDSLIHILLYRIQTDKVSKYNLHLFIQKLVKRTPGAKNLSHLFFVPLETPKEVKMCLGLTHRTGFHILKSNLYQKGYQRIPGI